VNFVFLFLFFSRNVKSWLQLGCMIDSWDGQQSVFLKMKGNWMLPNAWVWTRDQNLECAKECKLNTFPHEVQVCGSQRETFP
jgi:hypothetical protein